MTASAALHPTPLKFVVLVFALSVPFLLISAVTGLQLLPGIPVAGLAFVCPALAAAILVYREQQLAGVTALLKRSFDFKRVNRKVWYFPTLLLMPAVMVLAFIVQRLTGVPVPGPHFGILSAVFLCAGLFVGALGEELGWSGYAIDPMQARWGALRASLVLGLICASWHFIALFQVDRSVAWIAWWTLGTVSTRVIIVWLNNNTGKSVFVAALFHMTINLTWQLFPIGGSFYDARVTSLILVVVAASIMLTWRARGLRRPEHGIQALAGSRGPPVMGRR